MRKYWKLLLIAVIIVTTISAHYIQVANAAKQNYDVTFEKISGDDQYLDPLLIEANYQNGYEYSSVFITKDETTLLQRANYQQIPLTFQQLIDKHKKFMRGKIYNANSYYEDEAKLIYIEEPDLGWGLEKGDILTYNIDVLNKKENTSVTFSVQSKLNRQANWISIGNIAVVNNELKLITNHTQRNIDEEVHLIIIDINKQQLLSDTILETNSSTDTTRTSVQFYNDYYNLAQEKYVVYSINTFDIKEEEHKLASKQLKVLNSETNEISPVDLPEGVGLNVENGGVDNNYFIFLTRKDTGLMLYRYNIGQQQWQEPISVPYSLNVVDKDSYRVQALNDKLYLMNEVEKGFSLQIFDIEDGKTLYEGVISKSGAKLSHSISVSRIHEIKD